jgi:hypothetical protein
MRSWIARRTDRWLQRVGAAFVMELESPDGTRLLVGLDPMWAGAPVLAVTGHGDEVDWFDGLVVTDDSGDLVP